MGSLGGQGARGRRVSGSPRRLRREQDPRVSPITPRSRRTDKRPARAPGPSRVREVISGQAALRVGTRSRSPPSKKDQPVEPTPVARASLDPSRVVGALDPVQEQEAPLVQPAGWTEPQMRALVQGLVQAVKGIQRQQAQLVRRAGVPGAGGGSGSDSDDEPGSGNDGLPMAGGGPSGGDGDESPKSSGSDPSSGGNPGGAGGGDPSAPSGSGGSGDGDGSQATSGNLRTLDKQPKRPATDVDWPGEAVQALKLDWTPLSNTRFLTSKDFGFYLKPESSSAKDETVGKGSPISEEVGFVQRFINRCRLQRASQAEMCHYLGETVIASQIATALAYRPQEGRTVTNTLTWIINTFFPTDQGGRYYNELQTAKQKKGESVGLYYARLQNLRLKVKNSETSDDNVPEDRFRTIVFQGLAPGLKTAVQRAEQIKQLFHSSKLTLQEVVSTAARQEQEWQEREQERKRSRPQGEGQEDGDVDKNGSKREKKRTRFLRRQAAAAAASGAKPEGKKTQAAAGGVTGGYSGDKGNASNIHTQAQAMAYLRRRYPKIGTEGHKPSKVDKSDFQICRDHDLCARCGKPGHISSKCPMVKDRIHTKGGAALVQDAGLEAAATQGVQDFRIHR